ncbi:DUF4160 domain-containing protein [bacterium]|nr:DUF4160 domain-containing protein [bacterium]MBU1754166.1 DUF4160 domain-containing protein [bacterium]
MPEICRFYGIIIRMFVNEHPPAHFHAEYQDQEALFNIHTLEMFKGSLPKRARLLVAEWALEHRQELLYNWEQARKPAPLNKIDSLE